MNEAERDAAIEKAATTPKSATVDGNTVSQHNPRDVRDAMDHLAANKAAKRPRRGLLYSRFQPPSA